MTNSVMDMFMADESDDLDIIQDTIQAEQIQEEERVKAEQMAEFRAVEEAPTGEQPQQP